MYSRRAMLLWVACLASITSPATAALVKLTTPAAPSAQVVRGQQFDIEWTGGDATSVLTLAHLWGPGQSQGIANNIPALDGKYTWDTTGLALGWHDIAGSVTMGGDAIYLLNAPGRLEVVPEPTTLLIVTAAGLPTLLKRRRNA